MKKVKFNGSYYLNTKSDEARDKEFAKLEKMKEEDVDQWVKTIALGDFHPKKVIKPGEEHIISNWVYDMIKDKTDTVSISLDQFTQFGKPIPFNTKDAKKFGLMKDSNPMKEVKLIELIEDLDEKPIEQKRK